MKKIFKDTIEVTPGMIENNLESSIYPEENSGCIVHLDASTLRTVIDNETGKVTWAWFSKKDEL